MSPSPVGPVAGRLLGVSCTSATSCYAVGDYQTPSGSKTLVEHWDGTRWSVVPSPTPTGSTFTSLYGVSCASATSCSAVGYYQTGSASKALTELWNGTSWSIVTSPNSGATSQLLGVSCPSATSCFAVGYDETPFLVQKTFVEQWNGTSWSFVASPNPTGATNAALFGVSCPSTTSCFAVGYAFYQSGSVDKTVVEHWNGTSWSIVPSPNNGSTSFLVGVSCPTTTSCSAVGTYETVSNTKTLIEQWNGTTWSIVPSPNPNAATNYFLLGVSCSSATSCFAVGQFSPGSVDNTLIERWNGTTWSIVTSPNPTGAALAALNGVSCPNTTNCSAVGSYAIGRASDTLVEHWNGTSWSIAPPSGSSQSQLAQVACPSATNCFAVGNYATASNTNTLIEHWNGTSWSIVTSPNPTGATSSILLGVSCPNATSCFAVGFYATSSAAKTLVEHWNGTTWSIVTSPNPTGPLNVLVGVSCPSTTSCSAVGNSNFGNTLVEHWNGTSWSIVPSPNPSNATVAVLNAVSCPSTTSCSAVGYYTTGSNTKTLVEQWDGTTWLLVASPNPTGATSSTLNGVSCPSTTNCSAVGDYTTGSGDNTLIEHWNGTSWSIVTSPNPTGATSSTLNGVSCPSTTNCSAVGDYTTGSGDNTLIEHWNGTSWSIVTSPNPTGATDSMLNGVSCPSTTNCSSVGDYFARASDYTLIERYA